jgi:hypothetical protein
MTIEGLCASDAFGARFALEFPEFPARIPVRTWREYSDMIWAAIGVKPKRRKPPLVRPNPSGEFYEPEKK